jgi:nitrous oxide reductase accessory protein NosL
MPRLFLILFIVLLLSACGDEQTGVVDVKWDRDACKRCQMMLSDRDFSAQVRTFPKDKRSKVYKFDDLGCAVLWLSTTEFKDDSKTQIWVNDYKTKTWIDAKKAWYTKGLNTPMNYGLGAQKDKVEEAFDFQQAVQHINEVEAKLNIHGGNLAH